MKTPTRRVRAREDAGDVPGRRNQTAADGAQPGVVKRPVDRLRLADCQSVALRQNSFGRARRQSIQDDQPVALLGAVRKHPPLHLGNRREVRLAIRQTQAHRIRHSHQIEVNQRRQCGNRALQSHRPVSARIGSHHVTADAAVVEEARDGFGQIALGPAAEARGEFFLAVQGYRLIEIRPSLAARVCKANEARHARRQPRLRLEKNLFAVDTRSFVDCRHRSSRTRFGPLAWRSELTDAEDDEFGGPDDRHADLRNHLPQLAHRRPD